MHGSRFPTRDCASAAAVLAALAASCALLASVFVANFSSHELLFCVIFELISSLTPSLVAYVLETSLVISVLDTLMSVFVASPEPSVPW